MPTRTRSSRNWRAELRGDRLSDQAVIRPRTVDVSSALILWQVGVVGHVDYQSGGYPNVHLGVLISKLESLYGPGHIVTVYRGAELPGVPPEVRSAPLPELASCLVTAASTLFVPPLHPPRLDEAMVAALGLAPETRGGGRWAVGLSTPSENRT